VGESNSGGR